MNHDRFYWKIKWAMSVGIAPSVKLLSEAAVGWRPRTDLSSHIFYLCSVTLSHRLILSGSYLFWHLLLAPTCF